MNDNRTRPAGTDQGAPDTPNAPSAPVAKKSVFISHKDKDREAAQDIKGLFEQWGANLLHIFISERIEAGREWSREIRENLEKADYLLLLYTDPTDEWDWCLFEAGFFAGKAKEDQTGLVCLHSTKELPPRPLRQLQSIGMEEIERLMNFVRKLFTGINDSVAKSDTKQREIAEQIIDILRRKTVKLERKDWHTQYITLTLLPSEVTTLNQTGQISTNVLCGQSENEDLSIFGFRHGECTMDRLQDGIEEHYRTYWLGALGQSLRAASLRYDPIPPIPVLYSQAKEKDYHVVLHRWDRYTDGSLMFYLLFIERIAEDEVQDPKVRSIGDMLKLGRTFRWKILSKMQRKVAILKMRPEQNKVNSCLEELRQCMAWVDGEAARLDLRTPEDVTRAFETDQDKEKINEIIKQRWPVTYTKLMHGIDERDLDEILAALNGMLDLNKDYMVIAAGRHQQLLSQL